MDAHKNCLKSIVTPPTQKCPTNQVQQILGMPGGYYKHYDYSYEQQPQPTLTYSTELKNVVTITFKPNLLTIYSKNKNKSNQTIIGADTTHGKKTKTTTTAITIKRSNGYQGINTMNKKQKTQL